MKWPFRKAGAKPGTRSGWAVMRTLLMPHKGRITLLSLASLAAAMLEAMFIVLLTGIGMALVGGKGLVGPAYGQYLPINIALIAAAGSLVLRVVLSLVAVQLSADLTAVVSTEQRQRLSHAFLRTSWSVQQADPAGRLQELLTSFVSRITQAVSVLATAITASLSLVAFLLAGVAVDLVSTVAVLFALSLVGSVLSPMRRSIRRRSAKNARAGLDFANAVSELGALGLEMQTYGTRRAFEGRIDELTVESTVTQRRTQVLQGAQPQIYTSLAYGAVLAGVGVLFLVGFRNLSIIGAVMLLMLRSLSYGQQLSNASASIAGFLPFLEWVEEVVKGYADRPAPIGTVRPASVVPFEADDVSYAYTPDRTALSDVTFRLEPGEALGVIGPSGAGKSTLAQLLLGLRPPSTGTLRADGVPLEDIDRDWWSDRVAFVAQDARLFTGTVAENIRFFREGITEEELRFAARQANILADIEALPHGFDTHLGERGSQLSGGQRQRLSIARALVGKPELLILDEPTSALDGVSESLIRRTLADLHGRLTVVIIAHRMSTLDICDRIMVIEAGRMTALDTPSALRADSEFYRNALAVAGIA
ncbi:ABC transporter ATP-binding protein [Raineyella fluvialis]|uniref:ATP-binding cassette domain-containing protein n=1 Tax=Raineyella fluvialis TaxID=2662261 RepID=A0A5Q2FAD4_9ACTN|nr:ABC transporter ATP-binding protein [Raineyella fluvialis]QGF23648.1 ATP-binding cassette domain-containing protein [Raineyella fluvialis]